MSFQLSADMPQDRLFIAARSKPRAEEEQQQQQQQQAIVPDASQATGLEWFSPQTQKAAGTEIGNNDFHIDSSLGDGDIAVISSNVPTQITPSSVQSDNPVVARMLKSFRTAYRNSKSHNLLFGQFFANVEVAALGLGLSLLGIGPAQIARIQSEVREEALAEIDNKLKQDWAYSKALFEIVG